MQAALAYAERTCGGDLINCVLQGLAAETPALVIALSRLSFLECRIGPLRRGDQATSLRVNHGLRTSEAVMLTGDTHFQRISALQLRLIS